MPCTTILAGKLATNDGSTLISRNDDGGFEAKRLIVVQPKDQKRTYKTVISHLKVELPDDPMRYTVAPNVTQTHGVWPACGINAANVAMTATETITSNPRVLGADPYVAYQPRKGSKKEVPGGLGEEDLVTVILPYIHTAREGVLRMGALLEQYGTYEPNGMAFADENEVWWLETIGGHHWIAKRVPDDRVVIMPNQFGLDHFDFEDAYGAGKENLCSADLKDFVERNHLYTGLGEGFNPRLAFGSRSDSDHIYNTPRAWFMARYLLERTYRWDGPNADFTPESNDLPWSFVPERRITVEDIRYLLGSHYQGTPYDPYDKTAAFHGKYRAQQRCVRHHADPWLYARRAQGCAVVFHGRQRLYGLLPAVYGGGQPAGLFQRHKGYRFHRQHVLAQPPDCRPDRRALFQGDPAGRALSERRLEQGQKAFARI